MSEDTELPEHVRTNRAAWDVYAAEYVSSGERNWADAEPTWGIFNVPEREVGMLPERVDGLDVGELGCGTAYVSAWLARRGARPVIGVDPTGAPPLEPSGQPVPPAGVGEALCVLFGPVVDVPLDRVA